MEAQSPSQNFDSYGGKMSYISSVKHDIQLDCSAHSFYAFLYTAVAVFIKVYYNVGFEVW